MKTLTAVMLVTLLSGCAIPYQPRYRAIGDYTMDWERYDRYRFYQQLEADRARGAVPPHHSPQPYQGAR